MTVSVYRNFPLSPCYYNNALYTKQVSIKRDYFFISNTNYIDYNGISCEPRALAC